jgi:hypothetical protein
MDGLAILGLIVAAVAALDLAALRWGVDSRPTLDDRRERRSFRSI